MNDSYRHKGLRKKLVEGIKAQDKITDENVLKAIENVPRHLFMDGAFVEHAYEDKAFPIAEGQTISQPFTVAYQTQLLELKKGEKVLEIGTGSGYQSCVLAEMGVKVFSIERNKKLYEKVKKILLEIGYPSIKCFFGDGYEGIPAFALYDKIIVTAAAPEIPPKLVDQLKVGGIMVIPVGDQRGQKMLRITKPDNKNIRKEELDMFKFVPMLQGKTF